MAYTNQPPYTLTAMASKVRERIALVIERETPELAPELPFKRHVQFPSQAPDGDKSAGGGQPAYQQLEATTDPQRWRAFRVRVAGWGRGDNSDNFNARNYALRVVIEIGYPTEPLIKLDPEDDATVYDTDDLISHDFEQLDDVLNTLGIFGEVYGEPEIGGVDNIELLGTTYSGKVHRLAYLVRYERVRG